MPACRLCRGIARWVTRQLFFCRVRRRSRWRRRMTASTRTSSSSRDPARSRRSGRHRRRANRASMRRQRRFASDIRGRLHEGRRLRAELEQLDRPDQWRAARAARRCQSDGQSQIDRDLHCRRRQQLDRAEFRRHDADARRRRRRQRWPDDARFPRHALDQLGAAREHVGELSVRHRRRRHAKRLQPDDVAMDRASRRRLYR